MGFVDFLLSCFNDLPQWCYIIALSLFVISVLFDYFLLNKISLRRISVVFLIEHVILIVASTVIFRPRQDMAEYNYMPFWSYRSFFKGRSELLLENLFLFFLV